MVKTKIFNIDVVQYHPGLEFLSNMPIFQNRYS